ncbi:signal recognition particle, SRP9/SRP14 subunit, partial [Ephemerocybe angulata]
MVYVHSWQDFQDAAEALYDRDPVKTRYCVKWKAGEGKLVLKITNDTTCLKFKTYSSIFLNRFEALNLSLIEKMQNRQRPSAPISVPVSEVAAAPVAAPAPEAGSGSVPQAGGVKAGGVSKKKKGKKK